MKYTLKKQTSFYLFLGLLIVINSIFYVKRTITQPTFSEPISLDSPVNNEFTFSNKATIFVFIKPKCPVCILYKDSINFLYEKYNTQIQFVGLCNPKYWDSAYLNSYRMSFKEIDVGLRKSLHLAITPQFILVEHNKVAFAHNFNLEFQDEFKRLKKYLETRFTQ